MRRTRGRLESLTRFWHLWLMKDGVVVPTEGPAWEQVRDFLYFLASYRRRRSLESGLKMKGQSQASMTTYVSHLAAHLLPTLYPAIVDWLSLFETKGRTCKRGTVQLARTRDTPRAKQSYTENFRRTSHTAHHPPPS